MIYTVLTVTLISSIVLNLFFWLTRQKPKEYIEGKTIIELKILADSHLSDSDKAKLVHQELNKINWDKIEIWQKDAIIENLLEKIGKNNIVFLN